MVARVSPTSFSERQDKVVGSSPMLLDLSFSLLSQYITITISRVGKFTRLFGSAITMSLLDTEGPCLAFRLDNFENFSTLTHCCKSISLISPNAPLR